ncbi:MerC domain-containing protein [Lysobacter gummosus]|uniref:MerC domain-containing protein n=1 Tax=Lysobacter gummosus TaxID=262324 RepID=UPI00363F35AB
MACAVHCAALPLLIAVLPSLGIAVWFGDGFEMGFVMFATLLGSFSVISGYRRHHAMRALSLLIPGLGLLWVGVLYAPLHHALLPHAITMTCGGVLVGLAHLTNLRLNHGHIHDASCAH